MPQFITKSQYITVSKFFIDVLMPNANPTFVKVYLYALMLANDNMSIDNITIANKLGILESDVVGAFSYWQTQGIVSVNDGFIEFLPMPALQSAPNIQTPQSQPARPTAVALNPQPAPVPAVRNNQPKQYNAADVAKEISENEVLSDLAILAQTMLGKPLSTQDTITLYSFYDWLGFQPEIILQLLDHCVSLGKTNMKYIEKVAISWHEEGLSTPEAVDAYLKEVKQKNTFLYAVRRILGITDRALTQKEENMINIWGRDYGMTEEMVSLAYEYCVAQTQKLSLPYMDKILSGWHSKDIKTIEAAQRENMEFKTKNTKSAPAKTTFNVNKPNDYDYNEIERKMWENMKK